MAMQKGKIDPANIKPGQQQPQKYPVAVGPNYQKYGEVQGYVYDPYKDQYFKDKKAYEEYLYSSGQAERPKGPASLAETVLPVAAVGGTYALTQGLGKNIADKGIGGLFGLGDEAATTTAGEVAKTSAPKVLSGLEGLDTPFNPSIPGLSSGTEAASEVAATPGGLFDLGGVGSAGNAILPAAGALGAFDVLSNKKHGVGGALEGAASGAALGSYFGPPGAIVGAGIGGLTGFFGNFGDKDKWKTEGDRLRKLQESGVAVPQGLIDSMPNKGRTKEELIAEAQRTGGNVEFAGSRNEASLKPIDIVGYAAFAENDPTWFSKSLDERLAIAQKYLDAGAVREHNATVDLDHSKVGQPQPQPAKPLPIQNNPNQQKQPWMR